MRRVSCYDRDPSDATLTSLMSVSAVKTEICSASGVTVTAVNPCVRPLSVRAFLRTSGNGHLLIDALFDAHVLHLVKRSVPANDQPGVRYDRSLEQMSSHPPLRPFGRALTQRYIIDCQVM